METIKIGIIGAGRIGRVHAENITKFVPEMEIKTIADPYMSEETEKFLKRLRIPNLVKDAEIVFNAPPATLPTTERTEPSPKPVTRLCGIATPWPSPQNKRPLPKQSSITRRLRSRQKMVLLPSLWLLLPLNLSKRATPLKFQKFSKSSFRFAVREKGGSALMN